MSLSGMRLHLLRLKSSSDRTLRHTLVFRDFINITFEGTFWRSFNKVTSVSISAPGLLILIFSLQILLLIHMLLIIFLLGKTSTLDVMETNS